MQNFATKVLRLCRVAPRKPKARAPANSVPPAIAEFRSYKSHLRHRLPLHPGEMGAAPSKSGSPKRELSLSCVECGKPALVFECFVSDGPVHQAVSSKISEVCAFIGARQGPLLCRNCDLKHREQVEKEARELERQNAELSRQNSVRSTRSDRSANSQTTGRLRRRRSVVQRLKDVFFDDEDYITDHEESEVENNRARLKRNAL